MPWWVLAALVGSSASLLVLNASGTTWFPELTNYVEVVAWAVLILFGFLLFFRWVDSALGVLERYRDRRLRRRFSQLSDHQQGILLGKLEGDDRYFYTMADGPNARWFEDLVEWNYIEPQASPYSARAETKYAITKRGWREIQRFNRRQSCPRNKQ